MDFADQLFAGLIHAHHRVIRVVRQVIDLQNILHRRYKGGAPLWRNFPVFAEVRFKFVFFKMRCTVMCETDAANLSSTALSASNLTVQRWYPSGVSEQASAISRASNAPSKTTSRGGFTLGLRSSATGDVNHWLWRRGRSAANSSKVIMTTTANMLDAMWIDNDPAEYTL